MKMIQKWKWKWTKNGSKMATVNDPIPTSVRVKKKNIKCQILNRPLVIPGHSGWNPGKKKRWLFLALFQANSRSIPGQFQANSRQIPGQSQVIYDWWVESDIILEVLKQLCVSVISPSVPDQTQIITDYLRPDYWIICLCCYPVF